MEELGIVAVEVANAVEVSNSLTPEQWEYFYAVLQKIDVYSDYIVGILLFFTVATLCRYIYKFFNMFF